MTCTTVLIGLGATGRAIASSLSDRGDVEIVGAADADRSAVGRDLGTLLGRPETGIVVTDGAADLPAADLAIVATASDLTLVAGTVLPLLERGYNVLSICEQLAYPWRSHPDIARRLDEVARAHGVTVLGSGANPGVLMDTLPLVLSTLTQRVRSVRIRRRTSMSYYGAILSKFGLALTPAEFAEACARGEVVGHHGFEQSIEALATGLGWDLDGIEVDGVTPAIVTDTPRAGTHVRIEPGRISAVTHSARGILAGEPVIDLSITFGFFDPADRFAEGDEYRIVGDDQVIELASPTGFDSFLSTIAAAVNSATAVVAAPPGLLAMRDLSSVGIASKGRRLATGVR